MDESEEELEPLFDYRRVQPDFISIDDYDLSDSEKPSKLSPKRMKTSDPPSCKVEDVMNCHKKEAEEDDWLEPPPKFFIDASKVEREDSMLKELRLKKQELASIAQSAKDVLRAVEESAKREVGRSIQSSMDVEADQPSKIHDDRVKIIISIQDKDGLKQFRVYMDEKLEKLFKTYAEKVKRDLQNLVFCFDGDKVSPSATPGGLGMEDNDIIEVHIK